jgi:hypothetical protein
MEANGDRPRYFVLAYDRATMRVLSLSGHGHDFTGAVLTLTARVQEHQHDPRSPSASWPPPTSPTCWPGTPSCSRA